MASELAELQNAMAKLMISARQHDEQLAFLTRRIGELEQQVRRPQTGVPGFAPPATMPAPLPPPPTTAPPAVAPPAPRSSAPPVPSVPVAVAPPASPPTAPRSTPPAARPMTAADELYQTGLTKYQAGDLEGAVVSLYEVISTYPGDPARERAQFLIAEIFVQQKDFRGAIAEFESLIKVVPGSSRVPDALLQIGIAHRALGEEARAKRTWERLVREFPSSASARQARALMRTPAKS